MATFHARFHEDFFSVSRLIVSRANDLCLTRRQVVERLGFGDRLDKGHRVLSDILTTGVVPPYLNSYMLADALEVDQSFLTEVLSATARQIDAEQKADLVVREEIHRARFRPHLQVMTERKMPSPIFVAALLTTEQLRTIYLPEDIITFDQYQQNQIVRELIKKHYSRTCERTGSFSAIEHLELRVRQVLGDHRGDCEDFAIAKYVGLAQLGFSEDRLRIALVYDRRRNLQHALTVVYWNGDAIVLDSLAPDPLSHTKITRYRPICSFNRRQFWVHRPA